jgi:methylated-DNA-protein-cysteine methyltransferase related protein
LRRLDEASETTIGARSMSTLSKFRFVIARVPRGKVITYGQVAIAAGFPGAARLTVRALYRGSELPWHRVVGSGGRISLTGEEGREQRLRLRMEGVTFRGGRVRMDLHGWMPRVRGVPWKKADRSTFHGERTGVVVRAPGPE